MKTIMAVLRSRIALLLLLISAFYAIWVGGRVVISPGKIEIVSAPRPSAAIHPDQSGRAKQSAYADARGAYAVNSNGDINVGMTDAGRKGMSASAREIVQDARAVAEDAKALNATGDINIK